jgi:hypothetical protein
MHAMFSQDFFYEREHKEVHIYENFENYGVLENGGCKVYALLLLLFQLKFG